MDKDIGGWETGPDIHTLLCIRQITHENLLYSTVRCGDLNGKEIQKRGDICIHIAASLCCTAEAKHSIVKQLYYCKVISLQLKEINFKKLKRKI